MNLVTPIRYENKLSPKELLEARIDDIRERYSPFKTFMPEKMWALYEKHEASKEGRSLSVRLEELKYAALRRFYDPFPKKERFLTKMLGYGHDTKLPGYVNMAIGQGLISGEDIKKDDNAMLLVSLEADWIIACNKAEDLAQDIQTRLDAEADFTDTTAHINSVSSDLDAITVDLARVSKLIVAMPEKPMTHADIADFTYSSSNVL